MILEATLAADYTPGTNQSGDLACADWRFLLPSLTLGQVVSLGVPKLSTLRVLSPMAEAIHVFPLEQKRASLEDLQGFDNVTVHAEAASALAKNSISLILFTDESEAQKLTSSERALEDALRLLAPHGTIYLESEGFGTGLKARIRLKRLLRDRLGDSQRSFWLTKQSGELRTAVPLHERAISAYFFSNVLYGMSFQKRMLSKGCRMLSQLGLIDFANPQHATMIEKGRVAAQFQCPPQFLCELAARSGVDINRYSFGLSARGKYNSNKIIFFLFAPQDSDPAVIVKMTRVDRFNDRLEHEWEMLSAVEQGGLAADGTYPAGLFFGYHQGLAVLGQKAMHGQPFRTATTARPDCPVAADAIDWITHLGRRSADAGIASPAIVSTQLGRLFDIFLRTYHLSEPHRSFLRDQIESIGKNNQPFPVVFGHGDAGSWNVIVNENGRATFLDWEAADPRGMPLWDLFYFLRSYGNWVSRRRARSRDALKNFRENFLERGPLNDLLVEATNRYCEIVGLNKSLVAPLFFTCWIHRALRQATWADELGNAHFVNLIRMCIDARDAPGLAALLRME